MYDPGALGIIRIQLDDGDGDDDIGFRDYHNASDGSPGGCGDIQPEGSSNGHVVYNGNSGNSRYHSQSDMRGGSNHVTRVPNNTVYIKESSRRDRYNDPSDTVKVVYHRDGGSYDQPLEGATFGYRDGGQEGNSMRVGGTKVSYHHGDRRHYDEYSTGRGYDAARHDTAGRGRGRGDRQRRDKRFLQDVQHELEEQREEWRYEVERLLAKGEMHAAPSTAGASNLGTNSYVDTSGNVPTFTAFIDVREFSPRNVSVHLDRITNKVIVKAVEATGLGAVTKTFTHKVSMPRFADEQRLTSRMNKHGMLKIEVPLLYYFPQASPTSGVKMPKSFVYQVGTDYYLIYLSSTVII